MKSIFAAAALLVMSTTHTPSAQAQGEVMFSYQGRVKVQGQPFSGSGQFKFAIVNTDGNTTLWSNDGTGTTGNEPAAHLVLPVTDGIFNAMIGDPAAGMQSINSVIFQSTTPLKLRVWFNDGTRGFQQLNPDHTLVNLSLTTLETGTDDFTIYVDGTTGNDANNGLSSSKAKKTIQAAVDTLPERIKANVTIDVADGTYRETVRMFGLTVQPGKTLSVLGDETWTTSSASGPAVVISGADTAGATPPRVREYGAHVVNCSGITLHGLGFSDCTGSGVFFHGSSGNLISCEALNNSKSGFRIAANSSAQLDGVLARSNGEDGFYITAQSSAAVTSCAGRSNLSAGLRLNGFATAQLLGKGDYSSNAYGYLVQHASSIVFTGTATVTGNTIHGLNLSYNSYSENHTANTFSGNGSNIYTIFGGMTTY